MNTVRVSAADGVPLALHRLRADRDGRPAILLIHGAFSGHVVFLRGGLAEYLAGRGFDVWLGDLRHHGASAREPAPHRWRFEDWILLDAPALIAGVRREAGTVPIGWVGHSSGGIVGLCAAARGPAQLEALAALGSPGPERMAAPRWAMAALTIGICRTLGRFPARALRFGSEDEAAGILGQWMEWNVRGGWVGADGFDYYAALRDVTTPFVGMAGAADRMFAPPEACRQVVMQVGGGVRPGTLSVYPHLSHKGLLLDRRARDHCWPELATRLEEILDRR